MWRSALTQKTVEDFHTAALGFGGNMGDPKSNISSALRELNDRSEVRVLTVSQLYETPPWGVLDQPPFINACALIKTTLSPRELLTLCLDIEKHLGRVRDERWGPRKIDIDLLYFEGQKIEEPGLEVPHPRMTQRGFVMVPLAEISPNKVIAKKSVADWANELRDDEIKIISEDASWWR